MRVAGALYTVTLIGFIKAALAFSAPAESKDLQNEENYRLLSIFSKNKYGYNTRFMSDFELLLESVLNEKFLDNAQADALLTREYRAPFVVPKQGEI